MVYKKLGGFLPPCPLQGIVLGKLSGDLYSCKAISQMSDFIPEKFSKDVECWGCEAREFDFIEQLTDKQIKEFAKSYNGIAFKRPQGKGWIIKGICFKMRSKIDAKPN